MRGSFYRWGKWGSETVSWPKPTLIIGTELELEHVFHARLCFCSTCFAGKVCGVLGSSVAQIMPKKPQCLSRWCLFPEQSFWFSLPLCCLGGVVGESSLGWSHLSSLGKYKTPAIKCAWSLDRLHVTGLGMVFEKEPKRDVKMKESYLGLLPKLRAVYCRN